MLVKIRRGLELNMKPFVRIVSIQVHGALDPLIHVRVMWNPIDITDRSH